MEIRLITADESEQVLTAAHLFDYAPDPEATARFLASPGHHLLLAYEADRVVGFVSGVEVTHPDKGIEMFLYELAVEEHRRRRGIGRSLVERLTALAQAQGCYGMWVLTDEGNPAALATYRSAGGEMVPRQVVGVWTF
jgi:ribosomal protein S18 acetylase RimI-like enzyme